MSPPLVTVIIVTLNNLDFLKNCLVSIYGQDYKEIEILVVDNGSEEDIQGMLAREFPEVRIVRLYKNYGFAGGNNRGIEVAQGKYIALINNDTVASPQWIKSLVEVAESDPRIGAVASIIIDGNQPDILDSCGVGITIDGMSRQAMRGKPIPNFNEPKEVLSFSGCACLLRMEALRDVGLFDEDFFAYCEDTDLGLRLRWSGWKIVVAPDAYVCHFYSMTGGKFSLQKIYLVERNHIWLAIKNFPWFLLIILPFITVWRYILQGYFIVRGIGELNKFLENNSLLSIVFIYIRAYFNIIKKLPVMFIKRWEIFRKRQLKNTDMLSMILKFRLPVYEVLGFSSPPQ